MKSAKWFPQHVSEAEISPAPRFKVECVSEEWWLYSYVGEDDLFAPSIHKSRKAAVKRAGKNALAWLGSQIKWVSGK